MTKKEQAEFIERTIFVLVNGVALNRPKQIRAATIALARELDVALPANFPRE